MTVTILLFAQAVVFAILSGIVASNKNRDPGGWSVIGLLFGLFGFVAAVAVGEVEEAQSSGSQKSESSRAQEFDPDEHQKKCPDCAEYIKLEARVCKHCGHEFSEEEAERQIEQKRSEIEDERKDEKENKLGREYVLSSHNFDQNGVCKDCSETKDYVEVSGLQCSGA